MKERKQCEVEGCGSYVLCKGLCDLHYGRKRRLGTTELPPKTEKDLCSDCGTRWAVYSSGICRPCYQKRRRGAERRPGVCAHCGKPFLSKRRYSAESGRGFFCDRKCKAAARLASGKAAESSAKHRYMKNYGLTLEQVAEMRAGGCEICGKTGGSGRWGPLHIDHDHSTGKVRGALCDNCNFGIGKFYDDPALLRAAANYLERAR